MDFILKLLTRPRPLIERLLLAVALVAAAVGSRYAMWIEPGAVPFVTFYPAIAVAGLLPGIAPGVLALALTILLSWFVVLHPPYSFAIESWSDVSGLLVFAVMGIAFLVGGAALKSALSEVVRQRDAYIAKAELRQIRLHALRSCIGHYLRDVSHAIQKQCALSAGSIGSEALDEISKRLEALERLYRRLYAPGEFGPGAASLFVEDLCRDLVAVAAVPRVRCEVRAQMVNLETDIHVSLGLIVAELFTDALECAAGTSNTIEVDLLPAEPGWIRLSVRDVGGRSAWSHQSTATDDIPALTRALTHHMGGTVKAVASDDGSVAVTVLLPVGDSTQPRSPSPGVEGAGGGGREAERESRLTAPEPSPAPSPGEIAGREGLRGGGVHGAAGSGRA